MSTFHFSLAAPLLVSCLLAACGGGGSGSSAVGTAAAGSLGTTTASSTAGTSTTGTTGTAATGTTGTTATGTTTGTGTSATTTGTSIASTGGATTITTTTTTTTVISPATSGGALALRVSGNAFVDTNGNKIQLRGVNVSGLEFVAAQGWSPANPWGGQTGTATPDWAAIKTWQANMVRIPLNEASWLGYTCVDAGGIRGTVGATYNPDPGANYQATVKAAVDTATAAGLYVILDLHWTAPGNNCPLAQNPMPDSDNSLRFWTQVATLYKSYPSVAFEAFNEPFLYYLTAGETPWGVLRDGGTLTQFITGGTPYAAPLNWSAVGLQAVVNTIRATGARNVILASGVTYTEDLSGWLANHPVDPLGQLAATWHAYPTYGAVFGTAAYTQPNFAPAIFSNVSAILAAGFPVLITEFGDHNAPGTASAPFAATLLPQADALGVGYLGWAWDVFLTADNVLILDAAGTPTPGYGVYVKQHYLCRAAGSANCV